MTLPLIVLAVLSIFGGFINTPKNVLGLENIFTAHNFTEWLAHSVVNAHPGEFQPGIAIIALALAIAAIFLARSIYGLGKSSHVEDHDPLIDRIPSGGAAIFGLANARFYWDETYFRLFENPYNVMSQFLANTVDWRFWHDYFHDTVIAKGFNSIAQLLAKPVDLGIIDGLVKDVGILVRWISGRVRLVQTGYVRTYAVSFLLGVVLVIVILILPALQR
jgi:NADH-quinone oxidoreductase subunit L